MAIPKYKKLFDEVYSLNKSLFEEYLAVLENYDRDKASYASLAVDLQNKLLRLLKKTEDRLCMRSETTGHANYSLALAEKFWEEVRAKVPRIDDYIEEIRF
jgi:hypothetical protein